MRDIRLAAEGAEALEDVMAVMIDAFDPLFGEAWSAEQVLGAVAMPHALLLVARCDGPAGFALVRSVFDEAELMLLAVHRNFRHRGIGSRLLEYSCTSVTVSGARKYFLEVRCDNSAVRLYRKHGFMQVGLRRNYYKGIDGTQRDALTFRRNLP